MKKKKKIFMRHNGLEIQLDFMKICDFLRQN